MGIIKWSKKVGTRILPLLYFLVVSLPHHPFSTWLDEAFIKPVGYYSVQHIADIASWVMLAFVGPVCFRIAKLHRRQAIRHFTVLLLFVLLMYGADYYLVVNNIERVHFPQYAVLALLLGLSLRNEMLIFFMTSFAGFVDEFLQYVMNPMKTNYLDFNDIVFNIMGAAVGVVLLMGLRKSPSGLAGRTLCFTRTDFLKGLKPLERLFEICGRVLKDVATALTFRSGNGNRTSPPARASATFQHPPDVNQFETVFGRAFSVSIVLVALVTLVAGMAGRIVMIFEQAKDRSVFAYINGKLSFIMSFERHDKFWVKSYFGKVFHVLSLGEGVTIISLLSLAMWLVVRSLKSGRSDSKA